MSEQPDNPAKDVAESLRRMFEGNSTPVTAEDLALVYRNMILLTDAVINMFTAAALSGTDAKIKALDEARASNSKHLDEMGKSITRLFKQYYRANDEPQ